MPWSSKAFHGSYFAFALVIPLLNPFSIFWRSGRMDSNWIPRVCRIGSKTGLYPLSCCGVSSVPCSTSGLFSWPWSTTSASGSWPISPGSVSILSAVLERCEPWLLVSYCSTPFTGRDFLVVAGLFLGSDVTNRNLDAQTAGDAGEVISVALVEIVISVDALLVRLLDGVSDVRQVRLHGPERVLRFD